MVGEASPYSPATRVAAAVREALRLWGVRTSWREARGEVCESGAGSLGESPDDLLWIVDSEEPDRDPMVSSWIGPVVFHGLPARGSRRRGCTFVAHDDTAAWQAVAMGFSPVVLLPARAEVELGEVDPDPEWDNLLQALSYVLVLGPEGPPPGLAGASGECALIVAPTATSAGGAHVLESMNGQPVSTVRRPSSPGQWRALVSRAARVLGSWQNAAAAAASHLAARLGRLVPGDCGDPSPSAGAFARCNSVSQLLDSLFSGAARSRPRRIAPRRLRVAMVVQRYGTEVAGGAELLCRTTAERLRDVFELEILTTCAVDYDTWSNAYAAGLSEVNGVTVRRFPVPEERRPADFEILSQSLFRAATRPLANELAWMRAQGPRCPRLLDHISDVAHQFDAFIFYCYLYYPTYFGLQMVRNRSILVPTAHNEPPIYLQIFGPLLRMPKRIIYMTDAERAFCHRLAHNESTPWHIAGIGIDAVTHRPDIESFRARYSLRHDYAVFAGRICASKGCDELLAGFAEAHAAEPGAFPRLVLLGKLEMPLPEAPWLRYLGFLSEDEKNAAIAGARYVVNPSYFESLSILVLESWSYGVPVLVNGQCDVLRSQVEASGGGLSYQSRAELVGGLKRLGADSEQRRELGERGREFVRQWYSWEHLVQTYTAAVGAVFDEGEGAAGGAGARGFRSGGCGSRDSRD